MSLYFLDNKCEPFFKSAWKDCESLNQNRCELDKNQKCNKHCLKNVCKIREDYSFYYCVPTEYIATENLCNFHDG